MSLRALTSDTDPRKQWLGFLLLSTTLDSHTLACLPPIADLSKHLNHYLSQIQIVISKHDLLSNDLPCVALKAWSALT